jgi:hypothetical protein
MLRGTTITAADGNSFPTLPSFNLVGTGQLEVGASGPEMFIR